MRERRISDAVQIVQYVVQNQIVAILVLSLQMKNKMLVKQEMVD